MNIEPARGHLTVISTPEKKTEDTSSSGIIVSLEDNSLEANYSKGIVKELGAGHVTDDGVEMAVNYSVGDTIIYYTYLGKVLDKNIDTGEEYLILKMEEVLGKIIN